VITAIHGGPTGADLDAWEDNWAYPVNLLAQPGTFILRPNYHGSGNYGLKWVQSICCGKLTGQIWRLPEEKEVDSLNASKDGENTLDYWAGYAPNRMTPAACATR